MRTFVFGLVWAAWIMSAGTVAAAPSGSIPGDGIYVVGVDIAPGSYRSAGAADEFGCYWERLSGTSGDFDELIANDFIIGGQTQVTIKATDYAFRSQGCQTWVPVG